MLCHLYLRKGTVYVPTVAQTEAGFYLDIEPVRVVPISDFNKVRGAILDAIDEGNPTVFTPPVDNFPKEVVLKYATVKSWAAFERDAFVWTIDQKDGKYQIKPGRRRPDRGWEDDPEKIESMPSGTTPQELAKRAAELVLLAFEN